MVKKMSFVMLLVAFFSVFSSNVLANNISISVDGKEINADQPPVVTNGRTLVPLRSIFEALDATVDYFPDTRRIVATRGSTQIVLFVGSNQAFINNTTVSLEVPAQVVNGRTLVPVRFVSEALGDEVFYNPATRQVTINKKKATVSNLKVKDIGDYGDGRDLEISFNKAEDESKISQYRVMVVKSSKASDFNLAAANRVTSSNYVSVAKGGKEAKITLRSNSVDTDGALLQADVSYTVFVLTVSNVNNSSNELLKSSSITLTHKNNVAAVSNLSIRDVSDYGDGRDIEVNFTKISDETRLVQYRAIVVRADEANQLTLSQAKELTQQNYTVISKNGRNISQILSSSTRDNKGRSIQNGVAYRIFILSVGDSSRGYGSALSSQSSSFTLTNNPDDIRISNLSVKDVADYGDGRDIEVSFSIPSQETRVSEYRIMVVPSGDVNNFTLSKANNVSSSDYTVVSKNGYNRSVTLSSSARDINGNRVRSGTSYRIFVLSVGGAANSYNNSLSSSSAAITLSENFKTVAVSNVRVYDIADFGDGRDIQVTFNKVSDESKINEYRIMVVKSAQANGFNLAHANNVSSSNYTSVSRTGSNLTKTLSSSARDAYGDLIREEVEYRVFVLSVSNGGNSNNNTLSSSSSSFKLVMNASTTAPTNITAIDVGNTGDGRDMEVRFNKVANESNISEYRIMVVKANNILDLTAANNLSSSNYTRVTKTGSNIIHRLTSSSRDVDGDLIRTGVKYKVHILAVSSVGSSNVLSVASNEITLSNPQVDLVTDVRVKDVANNGNGQDLEVSFTRAADESNIAYYLVMVVRSGDTSGFNIAAANIVPSDNATRVNKTGSDITVTLNSNSRDVKGNTLANNTSYNVFVLSVADGVNATLNRLSSQSSTITLLNKSIAWSGGFQESVANDGSITGSVKATLSGETFASSILEGTHFTVSNLPDGLSVSAIRTANEVEFVLVGNATAHNATNTITNFTISFTNEAFTGGSATGVTNSLKNNIQINFMN